MMNKSSILSWLQGKLIVSCQAFPGEALYGSDMMVRVAKAARNGGAAGIRSNSPEDVAAIRKEVDLPVIGLWKREYPDSEIYITPTLDEISAIAEAGAHIAAMDATVRPRPGGQRLEEIVKETRRRFPELLLMADVSTLQEGLYAEEIGFDVISTTLSGYTLYSPQAPEPDFALVEQLAARASIPVFAEGRIHSPDQALRCLECGAFAVVVGTAITRPHIITGMFAEALQSFTGGKAASGAENGESVRPSRS